MGGKSFSNDMKASDSFQFSSPIVEMSGRIHMTKFLGALYESELIDLQTETLRVNAFSYKQPLIVHCMKLCCLFYCVESTRNSPLHESVLIDLQIENVTSLLNG